PRLAAKRHWPRSFPRPQCQTALVALRPHGRSVRRRRPLVPTTAALLTLWHAGTQKRRSRCARTGGEASAAELSRARRQADLRSAGVRLHLRYQSCREPAAAPENPRYGPAKAQRIRRLWRPIAALLPRRGL